MLLLVHVCVCVCVCVRVRACGEILFHTELISKNHENK